MRQKKWYGHPKTNPKFVPQNKRLHYRGYQIEITHNPIYDSKEEFFADVYTKKGLRLAVFSGSEKDATLNAKEYIKGQKLYNKKIRPHKKRQTPQPIYM